MGSFPETCRGWCVGACVHARVCVISARGLVGANSKVMRKEASVFSGKKKPKEHLRSPHLAGLSLEESNYL